MVKSSIPHLFMEEASYYKTEQWFEELSKQPDLYSACEVVTFTRVKNINSDYQHEYVQFIVEDSKIGDRARVYAERANKEIVDIVSVRPTRFEPGPDEKPDLPLPLTSLTFDRGTRPNVLHIAEILRAITIVGGGYELSGNNCFWFAATAYRIVKGKFPATEKQWSWINTGGDGGISLRGLYGFGVPYVFYLAFKPAATSFNKERKEKFEWLAPSKPLQLITPETIANEIVAEFKDKAVRDKYLDALHLSGVEVEDAEVERLLAASVQMSATEKPEQAGATWTEEIVKDVQEFNEKTLADPEATSLEKIYNEKMLANASKGEDGVTTTVLDESYEGPMSEEYKQLEQAMNVFAGRVLISIDFPKQ